MTKLLETPMTIDDNTFNVVTFLVQMTEKLETEHNLENYSAWLALFMESAGADRNDAKFYENSIIFGKLLKEAHEKETKRGFLIDSMILLSTIEKVLREEGKIV